MLTVLYFLAAAVFLSCLFWFLSWSSSKAPDYLKIKFKHFLTMYRINPNQWELYWDTVLYENYKEDIHQWFYFSFIDFLRYKLFYKKKKKNKQKINADKKWEKVIISWQKDINNYQEKYTKELQSKIKA